MKLEHGSWPVLLAAVFLTSPIVAQQSDVEIVNRDGEKISARVIDVQTDADAAQAKAGVSVKNENGKITIIEADGTKREIDVTGAQSIIVNQSVKSIMKDGEKQTESFGKAIIIGPDGSRQEIDLGGPIDGNLGLFPGASGLPGMVRMDRNASSKYMIGVNCVPIPESLSSQLNLETGSGLLVEDVSNDSPAQAAGIQKHDILMFADDTRLVKNSDLIEAVQRAGKENKKLSLTVIRGGKEVGVDLSPVERPASPVPALGGPALVPLQLDGQNFDLQWKQFGPGVIVGPDIELQEDFHKRMQEQMERMQEELQKMQEQMRKQLEGIDK